MGNPKGFIEFQRTKPPSRPVENRIHDWQEVYLPYADKKIQEQGARCMDCGIPFCHEGCPLGNLIPDWNDLAYRGKWRAAIERLHKTNNFPEWTGRLCPAPCVTRQRPPTTRRRRHTSTEDFRNELRNSISCPSS